MENFHGPEFGEITDVIWDGDNTIWDWVTYAVHAYEAMAQAIADHIGKPEPEVANAMKKFYTSVGTMEHEGLIQALELQKMFKDVPNYDRSVLIEKAQQAFSEARNKHLGLYPGVHSTFKKIAEQKIKNRILTDAPAFQAKMRIKRSRLNLFLHQVNAMPAAKIKLSPKFQDRLDKGAYSVDFDITEIPTEKPHSNLEQILNMTRDQIRRNVVIIGDNDAKDMELVRRYGCRGIHAVYGESKPEMLQRLLRFAPERVAKRNVAVKALPILKTQENKGVIAKVQDPKKILGILGLAA